MTTLFERMADVSGKHRMARERGAQAERDAIVAWLREMSEDLRSHGAEAGWLMFKRTWKPVHLINMMASRPFSFSVEIMADTISRGDHLNRSGEGEK